MTPYYSEDGIVIYHGDAREVLPQVSAFGTMVTDPPYGIGHSSNKPCAPWRGRQIANDESTAVRDEVLGLWDGPAIVFGTCRAPVPPIPIRGILVWDKGGQVAGLGDLTFPWKHSWEHIYVSGQGFVGHRDNGVLRFNGIGPFGAAVHQHEKPVALMRALVGKCPPLGDIVDPFMGSGTTLRAAKDLGRRAIGVDLEERYCELAAKRLAQGVLDLGLTP